MELEAVRLTNKQCGDVVRYYAPLLKISDWFIDVETNVPHGEISNAWGDCRWNLDLRRAEVRLVDPSHADPTRPYDMEYVLVHELTHISLAAVG